MNTYQKDLNTIKAGNGKKCNELIAEIRAVYASIEAMALED